MGEGVSDVPPNFPSPGWIVGKRGAAVRYSWAVESDYDATLTPEAVHLVCKDGHLKAAEGNDKPGKVGLSGHFVLFQSSEFNG